MRGSQSVEIVSVKKRGALRPSFLNAAEYILNAGNPNVILCERGIRTLPFDGQKSALTNSLLYSIGNSIQVRNILGINLAQKFLF